MFKGIEIMKAEIKIKKGFMDGSGQWIKTIYKSFEAKIEPLWWQERNLSFTASGYGSKIPTEYKVKFNNRWMRVYCTIYGNSGSLWIKSKGIKYFVSEVA